VVMLRTFPFSLSEEAKTWINELDEGTITSWNELREAFDKVVELERQINQGLRNRQAIIENLERQFKYLEKIQPTKSLPRTTNVKPRHEFVYKPPSIRNENDKGDDSTMHIPYMNAKMFAYDVLPNHVSDKELKSMDGVENGSLIKKEIKKDDNGVPKELKKE
ncbi:hypothetical protein Tco_1205830, partial [Tanacetum coccineum]